MRTLQKIYLHGLGAIGSTYAIKLQAMDPDCLKIIADRKRMERYVRNGTFVNGKQYTFNYIQPGDDSGPADLILIAVKQHHLEQTIKEIRGFVGRDTVILSLLNGISSEEILGREFGMDKMLYSFCVGTDAVREGTSVSFTKTGTIVFGERNNTTYSHKVEAVKELFERANIPYSIPEDMIRELWWKFMVNVGINQVSAILKAPYGVFHNIREARELMVMAASEVVLLSEAAGINLNDNDIDRFVEVMNSLSPEGKTSMLQDVEAGRKTEADIFSGTVMELGIKYGIETPVNNMLYRMIRTLEQM